MGEFFKSQDFGIQILKHRDLPVYITEQFDFYRCIEFCDDFYGKNVGMLHNGNLRICDGRYARLFPNQKLSYWADSPRTARMEIKKHGSSNNILTFWGYDDATSTFPTLSNQEPLTIIDGRKCGIQELIDKVDNGIELTNLELNHISRILDEDPDCLVYNSHACKGGENYIFFEKGFKKLAIREANLRLNSNSKVNTNRICCAGTSDYSPYIECYGQYFLPITKIKMDDMYLQSKEYLSRKIELEKSYNRFREENE